MHRPPHPEDWRPNPGPQTDFLTRTCFEALYGGAAGGGKSAALLVDAIRYVGRGYGPAYHAILFRRTFPELEKSLIKHSWDLYPRLGGAYNEQKKTWRFPGGERVEFAHIQHDSDVHIYQGAEFQFIGFDELTSFSESIYLYLFSRARSAKGVRCRVRAGSNPGNEGHEWVFKRWGAWLDPECATKAEPGQELFFLRRDDVDTVVPKGTPMARDRTFIPARLEDNPKLFDDGQYEATLAVLDPVTRERLRKGDWLIKPAKGLYFRREWLHFVDATEVPREARRLRYWDKAATEAEKGKDPDWTSGARLALTKDGKVYVEDVARMRGNPGQVQDFIKATAELDGREVEIGMEQEPGASGKADAAAYVRLLSGWNVRPHQKRVNKIVAAGPISAQATARNVYMVRGAWNEPVVATLEQFPEGSHDDDVDAISGAYTVLTTNVGWQGVLDWYASEAAKASGNAVRVATDAPAESPVRMLAPDKFRCTTMGGANRNYSVGLDGAIDVNPEDVEALQRLGFVKSAA
jgi:predicted phage terminase large subunit-like protein